MNYFTNLRIGLQRAWASPGAFYRWGDKIGFQGRLSAGALKSLNLAATLFKPLGVKLELSQRYLVAPAQLSEARRASALEFFKAFNNNSARDFVREAMISNYSEAIMSHHPNRSALNREEIFSRCSQMVRSIFCRLEDAARRPEFLFYVLTLLSRSHKPQESIWFPEFEAAYAEYRHNRKQIQRAQILSPFILGESLVDIGCGGGDLVAHFGKTFSGRLKKVAGIDVLDWKTPGLDIAYHILDFSQKGSRSPEEYDTGMLLAVLHHVGKTEEAVIIFLEGVRSAVRKRLIVEEDVIFTPEDLEQSFAGLGEIQNLRRQQPILDEALGFDYKTQRDIAIIIDVLANSLSVGVPEMNFPFGFRTLTEWVRIFNESGFVLNKLNILGFQKGNFNQQCHVHFILDRK